jgi:hypothetical protein
MYLKKLLIPLLTIISAPAILPAQTFEYSVKHRHLLKDCKGALTVTPEGIEYKTSGMKDSRNWNFDAIRIVELKSPTELSIVTYEDQKRWAGKDKIFEFTLLDKKATPELSSFLLDHVKRPLTLAVLPEVRELPAYEIPVKHLRNISGTQGLLKIYPDKVVYQTSTVGDSRYWRIADIESFSQPDRFRFQIVSFLPKIGGPAEAYNFQLLQDLPEGAYDYLWIRLHPSSYYPVIRR